MMNRNILLVLVSWLALAHCGGGEGNGPSGGPDCPLTVPEVGGDLREVKAEVGVDSCDMMWQEGQRTADHSTEVAEPTDIMLDASDDGSSVDICFDSTEPDTTSPPDQTQPPDWLDISDGVFSDIAADTDDNTCQVGAPECMIKRVVLAGDSWSCGLILPLRAQLDARGYQSIELSSTHTTCAGSTVAGWLQNQHPPAIGGGQDYAKPKMLDALKASLDADPPARILFVVLGGNDYNAQGAQGLGTLGLADWMQVFTWIQQTIQAYVDIARAGRPHLRIVLVGYDYFHFEFLQAFGLSLEGLNTYTYNMGLVELDKRRRDVALSTPNVMFAHNLGILQHTYGDTIHPPFTIPNPLLGFPEYGPGQAPKPGPAPDYVPFPGGWPAYPAPLTCMPDGLHPNPAAFTTIISNTLDQIPEEWFFE